MKIKYQELWIFLCVVISTKSLSFVFRFQAECSVNSIFICCWWDKHASSYVSVTENNKPALRVAHEAFWVVPSIWACTSASCCCFQFSICLHVRGGIQLPIFSINPTKRKGFFLEIHVQIIDWRHLSKLQERILPTQPDQSVLLSIESRKYLHV